MAIITTLGTSDSGAVSRTTINDNFTNLNTDKLETSVLSTDGTLAGNSDTEVPSEKAVKTYVDTEVAGATVPSTNYCIPSPTGIASADARDPTDTTAYVGLLQVPFDITVNKVSLRTYLNVSTSPFDITMYSEDGQTQLFAVSSAGSHSTSSIVSISVPSVAVTAGNYWFMVNADSATLTQLYVYLASAPFASGAGLLGDVAGETVLQGTYTITSGTPPSTLTLASVTDGLYGAPVIRLDN